MAIDCGSASFDNRCRFQASLLKIDRTVLDGWYSDWFGLYAFHLPATPIDLSKDPPRALTISPLGPEEVVCTSISGSAIQEFGVFPVAQYVCYFLLLVLKGMFHWTSVFFFLLQATMEGLRMSLALIWFFALRRSADLIQKMKQVPRANQVDEDGPKGEPRA